MTTELISPTPVFKAFDNNGAVLAGGKLFTYQAGTTTKLSAFADSSGVTPQTNPIILNSRGEATIWIPPNVAYKYILSPSTDTDPPTSPIWTVDQIVSSQTVTLYGGVDSGAINAYVLNFVASFSSYTDGTVIYFWPLNSNNASSTLTVNSLGAVTIFNPDGSNLQANQILANQPTAVMYKGSSFYLLTNGMQTGTFSATFASGWTTTPSFTWNYTRVGNIVTIYTGSNSTQIATSNSVNSTISGVPAILRNSSSAMTKSATCKVVDNGASKGGWAFVDNFGNINLGLGFDSIGGGFTATNIKGVDANFSITYAIT